MVNKSNNPCLAGRTIEFILTRLRGSIHQLFDTEQTDEVERDKVCGVGRDVLDTKESSRRMLISLTKKARDLVSSRARSSYQCNNTTM